ncbi:MAG: transglutaminase-like domain-containing protein [Bacteroidales bacterium]|jgi:transglutaminase-like putative cysteine protease
MKNIFKIHAVLIILVLSGCSGRHLITDLSYRQKVDSCFSVIKRIAINRETAITGVFNQKLSTRQKEALEFLYAFMPLNDLADYNSSFFLANVNLSLKARKETSWGKTIPSDVFLHYVLPVRVNNENLDSFRIRYYDEILSRVRNMNISGAALEINHWCHEKVTYQPSDSRTSAPLSTILSARGRCGEESTFTVAALRTAGIPARQVYTPRWAHCDDNHAWVEFWNNGQWSYMGACEPEPVPDRGWFTEPARRAMLVNSRSYGAFSGNENTIIRSARYSIVNDLSKYAVTKRIFVKVEDISGMPVKNAIVEYQLYNYAEFYPLATVPTDANGISSFETGLGDLLVWGRKNDEFDFRKISVTGTDTVHLALNKNFPGSKTIEFDLSVPVKRTPKEGIPPDLTRANDKRMEAENSIRDKYTGSWIKHSDIREFAISKGIDTSKALVLIAGSMGNFRQIMSFISSTPDSLRKESLDLLGTVSEKDLRDAKSTVLEDHLLNCMKLAGSMHTRYDSLFVTYVLNPRISDEALTPWRSYFQRTLSAKLKDGAAKDPSAIARYLDENIKIDDDGNFSRTPITPVGVCELKVSDDKSRSICFVAMERSLGIPARLEPGSDIPQYYINSEWNDVFFSNQEKPSGERGYIKLTSHEKNPFPSYYRHFTLARFDRGRYNTLDYEEDKKATDFSELPVIPGHYMLVTGNRLNDGGVLSEISFFDIAEGEHKTIEIRLRHEGRLSDVPGKADPGKILSDTGMVIR